MERVRLRSGREVDIRPIRASDGPSLRAAYDHLSPRSKYRRFLAPKPHLSEQETRYLVRIDGLDHVALVATDPERPDWILGVARFVRLPEAQDMAEFSVVVGDPYQREGLGSQLLLRLARAAADRGITRFRATLLAENDPAQRLVRAFPGTVAAERFEGPVREIEVALPS